MNIKLRERLAGLGLIGWIVAVPLALILLLILVIGFYEGRKVYWDHKVTEMCKKDGGIKIHERVQLDEVEYSLYIDKLGNFTIPREDKAPNNLKIVSRLLLNLIHRNKPMVRRFELQIIRRTDNKLLGTMISYGRTGGDFFALHPSSFLCPEESKNLFLAVIDITKIKGE